MSSHVIKLDGVSLDARDYASQGTAVLGIRDSGKTYTSTFLGERLMDAGIPITALDPSGVWKFLRVSGKGQGYPVVVAGGEHGDLPLTPAAAPEIMRAAMREGVSLVLDLYSMTLSKADWRRIVQSCVDVMLYENKAYGLRHIFIEEAAEFCPQIIPKDGVSGAVYASVEKLARIGGNALLGYTLVNQRAEQVNKAVLELCDNLFLHRQKGKNSISSLRKWLDVTDAKGMDEIIASLPTLPQGECWAWLAGSDTPVRVKVPVKRTFHPDRRAMRDATVVAAEHKTVNVSTFVSSMQATLDKIVAEAKANDPAELRKRIRDLERQLADQAPREDTNAAVHKGYEAAMRVLRDSPALKRIIETLDAVDAVTGDARRAVDELQQMAVNSLPAYDGLPLVAPLPARPQALPAMAPQPRPREEALPIVHNGTDTPLDGPQKRLLGALNFWRALGRPPATRAQAAAVAGWKVTSGHLKNVAGALHTKGLIEYPTPGTMALTPEGKRLAPALAGPPNVLDRVRTILDGPQRQVVDYLAGHGGLPSRADVATGCGWNPSSGHVKNVLGSLHTLKVIEYPTPGVVTLAEWAR